MKHLFFIWICVASCAFAKAESYRTPILQEFISHQVTKGETVYSIARKYKITEKEIIKLNPDAKDRVYEGLVLILPSSSKKTTTSDASPDQEDIRFKKHKVRRKETLYSISKKYNVTQDAIKKYNKRLYSETLRKGDRIRIPLNYVGVVEEKVTIVSTGGGISQDDAPKDGGPAFVPYVVQPKETKYGIARLYGITIAELEEMNPGMGTGLKVGERISVPNTTVLATDTAVINEEVYAFYEVQKGNTIYSLLKEFNINVDELVVLNPTVADGLKEGMILKVPKGVVGTISTTTENTGDVLVSETTTRTSLLDSLSDYSKKKVVLMLPFGLKRTTADTLSDAEDIIKNDRVLRFSLDFYSGALMALETAKGHGISTDLEIYDTDYVQADGKATNARKVESIISSQDFTDVDVVIGPLISGNFNRASSLLARQNIPLISPQTRKVDEKSNVFQSRPSEAMLRQAMLDYLKKEGADKNIIIIADAKNAAIKGKLISLFPNAKVVNPRTSDDGLFLYPDDIPSQISDTKENWVIIETGDVPLISTVTTRLNTLVATHKITLFTTNRSSRTYDSDAIQHMHLMHLNFHFPSMNKEYKYEDNKAFIDAYEEHYKISPSEEAIRGYDIMYDTLLRLAFAKDLYSAASTGMETDYIENKFRYGRKSSGGFYNTAIYLMKYTEDLKLEEVVVEETIED
ncbi:LysM peptidoglycan-binding domain-containing protein [Dokdonia sp.]|uniref:LysM peptidoglycan-binding domain-containing protein n=1 Tax=Dokdonia sp. TaxID=2024995 RepID=UPI003266F6A0